MTNRRGFLGGLLASLAALVFGKRTEPAQELPTFFVPSVWTEHSDAGTYEVRLATTDSAATVWYEFRYDQHSRVTEVWCDGERTL